MPSPNWAFMLVLVRAGSVKDTAPLKARHSPHLTAEALCDQ